MCVLSMKVPIRKKKRLETYLMSLVLLLTCISKMGLVVIASHDSTMKMALHVQTNIRVLSKNRQTVQIAKFRIWLIISSFESFDNCCNLLVRFCLFWVMFFLMLFTGLLKLTIEKQMNKLANEESLIL